MLFLDPPVGGGADVHPRSGGFDHGAHDLSDAGPVHPVKRLSERRDPEATELGRQLLGARDDPLGVHHAPSCGLATGRLDHLPISVDADDLLKQRGEQERQAAGPAPHVQQPAVPIQAELDRERLGHRLWIGQPPRRVVGGTAAVERLVPLELAGRHRATIQPDPHNHAPPRASRRFWQADDRPHRIGAGHSSE